MDDHSAQAERWLPVVGHEGCYEVSDLGRIRSIDRTITRRDGIRSFVRGRLLKPVPNRRDRPYVSLGRGGRRPVAQLVLEAFIGPRPDEMECCHRPGGVTDSRLANLRWDTSSENMYDRVRHGTHHMSKRTHCPQGHALVQPNLVAYDRSVNRRNCLACNRARATCREAMKRGRKVDFAAAADRHHRQIMDGSARRAGKYRTHCPRGHVLAAPNLRTSRSVKERRHCLACYRARHNESYALQHGRSFDFQAAADRHYAAIMTNENVGG